MHTRMIVYLCLLLYARKCLRMSVFGNDESYTILLAIPSSRVYSSLMTWMVGTSPDLGLNTSHTQTTRINGPLIPLKFARKQIGAYEYASREGICFLA